MDLGKSLCGVLGGAYVRLLAIVLWMTHTMLINYSVGRPLRITG